VGVPYMCTATCSLDGELGVLPLSDYSFSCSTPAAVRHTSCSPAHQLTTTALFVFGFDYSGLHTA